MAKPKISSDWMAGCAGCHMSLLDMDERILQVVELADLRATPITDLKEPDASGVDVGILEGGVNNSANEEVAHRMRARSKILVALGDCELTLGHRDQARALLERAKAIHANHAELGPQYQRPLRALAARLGA